MEAPPIEKRLLVVCQKRQLETVMQQFEDWNVKQGIEVTMILYGTMQKSNDGFVLFALNKPLPEGVYLNLELDPDIVDFVHYPATPPPTEIPAS
jgi:hypothetical protein